MVRATPLVGTADQGIVFTSGKYLLGGTTTTVNPFTANRNVNLDASNLSFTSNGGALTPVKITGGAAPQLDVVGATNITGATTIAGTTLINSANALNTTIGNTGTVAINGTAVNVAGITGITGATTIAGTTLINNASAANATTGINTTSGTGAVTIGNAATTTVGLNGVAINATGATTVAGTLTQTGAGNQVTLNGNVDATNGLDVTTAALTANAGALQISGGVEDYLKVYTTLNKSDVESIMAEFSSDLSGRTAQKRLAFEITTLVHGEARAIGVQRVTSALFGEVPVTDLNVDEIALLATEIPSIGGSTNVIDALVESRLAGSKGEARRFIKSAAVSINGKKNNNRPAD